MEDNKRRFNITAHILSCALFLLMLTMPGYGQQENVWFRNLALKQGLPNTTIFDLHQDNKGFVWATTQSGIVRYDGYEFKTYKIPPQDGIPSSNLPDVILEDDHGVLWVGYQDNHYIARYDSQSDTFDYLNLKKRLDINGEIRHTRLLGIDDQQQLWVALVLRNSPDQSILLTMDIQDQSIFAHTDEKGDTILDASHFGPRFFAGNVNYNPFVSTSKGVWIGAKDGLNFISRDEEVTSYTHGEKGFRGTYVNHLLEVDNQLWVASDSGLVVYNRASQSFSILEGWEANKPVMYLYKDNSGAVWITGYKNSYRYNDGELTELNAHPDLQKWGHVSMVPQLETEQEIWFVNRRQKNENQKATTRGFTIYDKSADRFVTYRSNFADLGLQSGANITGILEGKSGSVWLSTMYTGLYQFPRNYKKFEVLFNSEKFEELAGDYRFFSAAESPNGHVFATLSNGKLLARNAFTGEEKTIKEFEVLYSHRPGDRNFIPTVYFERPGVMYVPSERSGFNRFTYDPQTLEIKDHKVWLPEEINDASVINMIYDDEGNLWLGTTDGIVKADLDNETFRVINADKAESFRRYNNFASDFLKDSKGYIWIYNVLAGGIKRLNPQKETVVLFNNPDDDVPEKDVLPFLHGLVEMDNGDIYTIGDYIYKLNEDSLRFERFKDEPIPNMVSIEESAQGQLVVATYGEGVFWINPKTKEIDRRISAEDGLANSSISDMRIDEQGRYWLLTSLGLSIYNPKQDVVTNYYENHGLPASESQINYKFFGNDSTYFPIWLSNKGLSAVHVNQMETNSYSPSPVFTNITADDESLLLSESNSITLSPDQREVTVAFSALQFDDPSKNQYRYSFEGADWSSWSRKRSVQLAGLAPGTYTLEVQSRNPDLIPSANVATLSLTVLPPWYQTAWAWTLLGVTILGALGWGARRYSDYRTEQEYLRLQAEQSERLQKIDQLKTNLLLNISHELRTPLTLILAPIDQLRRRMQTNEPELKRPLEIARRNGKRMQQLVEQVLDLARLEMDDVSFEVRPIEINKQLKRLVDFFESLAEFNEVELQLKPLPEEEMLWVDPDKFEKVIINLISNAIKFTESGGEVVVRMDKQDGQLRLQVQDSGKGIAPERLEQIFERFETSAVLDAQGAKGLGVGLSIAKEYVELHHGRITVKSQPGEGTIFTITLPLGKDHIAEEYIATDQVVSASEEFIEVEGTAVEIKPRTSLLHGEKPLILVIEDNEDLRSFMVDILREDYRVETAWDGKEGVKRAQVLQPDLVITDIMMPEMDGFGVIEKLRSQHRFQRLPIVVLSARSEMADRLKGFEMGVNAYIGKPFNTDELLVRVRNMLELKEKRDEASADSTTSKEQLSEDEQTLKELIEYVNEHIQESTIKVETLAEVINVSRSSLYRLLKANTGFTPAEFVRELKLQKASELIEKNPKLTIAELADRVGYSNSTYFSRLYKERFGKRPK